MALPIVILFLVTWLVSFNQSFYIKEYVKYNVGENVNLNKNELVLVTNKVLNYLGGISNNLDFKIKSTDKRDFFSDRDKQHMIDVRNIFDTLRNAGMLAVIILSICIVVMIRRHYLRLEMQKFLRLGAIIGILPFIIIGVAMMINFEWCFITFHKLLFTNDLWLLDPAVDNLVNIFPEQFFTDMAWRICTAYIVAQLALILLSFTGTKSIKRRTENAN